jgi:hypothetical protein
MRVVDRLRMSLQKRACVVLFRTDVATLGGSTQVGDALRSLIADGELIRLGEGIYAKASRDSSGRPVPAASLQVLLTEILRKLGVDGAPIASEEEDGFHKRLIVDAAHRKIARRIEFGDFCVEIVTRAALVKPPKLSEDPTRLPRQHVQNFIERLARWHQVSPNRTGLDRWAEAVTRASGDTVKLDSVGHLLAKLKQKHVINGRQMAHLMNNYVTERDSAKRSV